MRNCVWNSQQRRRIIRFQFEQARIEIIRASNGIVQMFTIRTPKIESNRAKSNNTKQPLILVHQDKEANKRV